MSKPATIVLGAIGVVALAVVLGAFALRNKPRRPASVETHDRVALRPPVVDPDAVLARAPLMPAPDASPKAVVHRRQSVGKDAGAFPTQASLMAKLHELEGTNPPLSLQLAREAVARFPDSPDAPEFEWNVVKSLVNLERFKEAQAEARIMVQRYPGTSWTADIERHVLSIPLE